MVFEPDVLRIAPTSASETVTPSPAIDRGSPTEIPPESERVALLETAVPVDTLPSADEFEIATMPVVTEVAPV